MGTERVTGKHIPSDDTQGVLTGQVPVQQQIDSAVDKHAQCQTCGEPDDHEHTGSE